jgi:hypothetical protein
MKLLNVMNSHLVRSVFPRPASCRLLVDVYVLYFYSASTMERADADARTMCIVWWPNPIQCSLIRQYNSLYNLQTGDRFIVRMLPGCDTAHLTLYRLVCGHPNRNPESTLRFPAPLSEDCQLSNKGLIISLIKQLCESKGLG